MNEQLNEKLEKFLKKKRNNNTNNGYIKYKDIIEEKLKENKKEEIFIKKQQSNINKHQKIKEEEKKLKEKNDKTEKELLQQLKDKNTKNEKIFKINIIPSKIIKEIKEQDERKRIIEVEKYTNEYKCKELYNWFHLTFIDWEKSLSEEIKNNKKELNEVHSKLGIYKQCRGYIKKLLIDLKENTVPQFILDKLFQIMVFCIDKDYIRANDNYFDLSIGDAPWPMGVTMVGIHERTGRSKIYNSQVAYILNDDITKKYLQGVKRVMSFIQRENPKHPSQTVFG